MSYKTYTNCDDAYADAGGSGGVFVDLNKPARVRLLSLPVRYQKVFKEGEAARERFAWKCLEKVVVNGEAQRSVRVLDCGPTVYNAIRALVKTAEWGDPTEYDINIVPDGEGLKKKFMVSALPKTGIGEADAAAITAASDFNLLALLGLEGNSNDVNAAPVDNGDYDPFREE